MQPLTLQDLESPADPFDEAVGQAEHVDRFCSSTSWVLPAHEAIMPKREPWIRRSEHGWAVMAKGFDATVGHYIQPLEAAWNFATGLVGPAPGKLIHDLRDDLRQTVTPWNLLLFSGIAPRSPYHEALLRAFGPLYRVGFGSPTIRHRAGLNGGLDGFLSRRTRKFRANLRRVQRRAAESGIVLERHASPTIDAVEALYARVLAIETQSWKGREGSGIVDGSMREFYRLMLPRLAARGALRLTFAQRDGQDVAFIVGGVLNRVYRGLQISYDHRLAGLSLGNLLQAATVADMCEESVLTYDLGCEMDYKAAWADDDMITITIAIFR